MVTPLATPVGWYALLSQAASFRFFLVILFESSKVYSVLLSNACSCNQTVSSSVELIVSRGYTSSSVFLAMANLPPPTAFQPPNSSISFTAPFATSLLSPKLSIFCESFVLFSTVESNPFSFSTKVPKSAFSAGDV